MIFKMSSEVFNFFNFFKKAIDKWKMAWYNVFNN